MLLPFNDVFTDVIVARLVIILPSSAVTVKKKLPLLPVSEISDN